MRVLAVAQHGGLVPGRAHPGREAGALGGVGEHVAHPGGDGTSYVAVWTNASAASAWRCCEGEAAGGDRGEHVGVAVRRGDDRDRGVVLGGRAHHRRAADVDLLDALVGRGAGGDGLGERVEVGDDQVERLDAELDELLDVGGQPAVGEDARVHARVQRLDPAVEALGEAGELLDLGDRDAQPLDQGRGAAGGDERDAGLVQAADELLEPGLVVDRDQRAADRRDLVSSVIGRTGPSCR